VFGGGLQLGIVADGADGECARIHVLIMCY
jgi:hypothetical protein